MIETPNKSSDLVEQVINSEKAILLKLDIENRLCKVTANPEGQKKFAQTFYFVRCDFPRLNFILGARCCGADDFLWKGLVKNLMEELGGDEGRSHNQLYEDFLTCVGTSRNELPKEPLFARQFNQAWEDFVRNAPLKQALCAIAVYEIFDQPDYALLLEVMKKSGVPEKGLLFFQVHAAAEHFTMYEDMVSLLTSQEGGQEYFNLGRDFVTQTQKKMWCGLLENLEEGCSLLL